MRWIYRLTFTSGRRATVISTERVPDCLDYYRARFGAGAVVGVSERYGTGEAVEHCWMDDRKAKIVAAIAEFNQRSARR